MSFDAWNTVISLAGLVLSTVGIGFVAVQVTLARRQALDGQRAELREYERLRRQATLDFVSRGRGLYLQLRSMLPDDWDDEAVARYVADAYASNDAHRIAALAAYMGHYESLACETPANAGRVRPVRRPRPRPGAVDGAAARAVLAYSPSGVRAS